ncbi:dihydrodipicolinate synthase family protein [Ructibacterium gallinarum]|uniref:Dihydrodipicolinate synthase family protein n=1 Tax=Ructibacterium gallinarum TaxID=2779355 RepID=A0A9D5M2C6_9FIRM|nr:dihydrodipicolinate synthase family protein [Ructibacterium gallinarum]MBE5041025.1 dihydrodipicolinate synthase family protein [Ructibacterium gallinarum]
MMNSGIYPTMITPFGYRREIDYDAVVQMVKWYNAKRCNGIFAVCQSSEMFHLSLVERIRLAAEVVTAAKNIGSNMSIVASGHVSASLEAQVEEVCAMAETGIESVVLVSNRLDLHQESDSVWINNAEYLLSHIPSSIKLGIYECPYPYKRLLSEEILNWCVDTKRFYFLKDTCCDPLMLKKRLKLLQGSQIKLFNANAQTLLLSLQNGASGYSGVMANFHPELYGWLCANYDKNAYLAQHVQGFLSLSAFTESMAYPVTAKYHMNKYAVKMDLYSRSKDERELTEYQKSVIDQMHLEAETIMQRWLAISKKGAV